MKPLIFRAQGNDAYKGKRYDVAVEEYSEAIRLSPHRGDNLKRIMLADAQQSTALVH